MMPGPVSPLAVVCPVCLSAVGRPCANRRGYLLASGVGIHRERARKWLGEEAEEPPAESRFVVS